MNDTKQKIGLALATISLFGLTLVVGPAGAQHAKIHATSILDIDKKLGARMKIDLVPLEGTQVIKYLWGKTGYEFTYDGDAMEFEHSLSSIEARL